jgi:hypothetical protein
MSFGHGTMLLYKMLAAQKLISKFLTYLSTSIDAHFWCELTSEVCAGNRPEVPQCHFSSTAIEEEISSCSICSGSSPNGKIKVKVSRPILRRHIDTQLESDREMVKLQCSTAAAVCNTALMIQSSIMYVVSGGYQLNS